jgi:uridine kinase
MTTNAISIGICGGSGAGKTTLAKAVYNSLKQENVAYLVHDNYYKDISHKSLEDRAKNNFDHPDSLDTELLIQHVKDLKNGSAAQVPTYDFATHMRKEEVKAVEPKKIILVEGILIFANDALVDQLDIKVFVDADADVRLLRRIVRDTSERGRTADQVLQQYEKTVKPMHEEFVEPSKKVADFIVRSDRGEDLNNTNDTRNFMENNVALNMIVNHLKAVAGIKS